MAPHPPHHIRRIVLPSGKTVEVVYFEDRVPASAGHASRGSARPSAPDLHICGNCSSDLVYASDWHAAHHRGWVVTLRCPDCEWTNTDVFEQPDIDRFDATLVEGTDMLVEDLRRLAVANAEEEIERFAAALRDDKILPEDF